MWMIRTKDGMELTEKEFKYWDNIPRDVEIKSLGVAIAREKGLEPLAVLLLAQAPQTDPKTQAKKYIEPEKAVASATYVMFESLLKGLAGIFFR